MVKVFLTMMALKDADQVVRVNAFGLGRRCWPMDADAEGKVLKALKILSEPDKKRKEKQAHDGRRIERVEGGWLILNGQEYEDLMRSLNRRNYKAAKQREYREKIRKLKENGGLAGEVLEQRGTPVGDLAGEIRDMRLAREGEDPVV